MSDQPQGPGWWFASDGKWYPPQPDNSPQPVDLPPPSGVPQYQQQPQYQQPQYQQPQYQQPQYGAAAPAPKKSRLPWVLGAVALVLILGVGGCIALIGGAAKQVADESRKLGSEAASTTGLVPADSAAPPAAESSFVDRILTTPEMVIKITDVKTLPVGAAGNEYGKKPVIAFWYEVTNLTDKGIDPSEWIFVFRAYQDNNPNAMNKLDVGSLPDDRFLDSQMEDIKKGGTVANAVAYELDDLTTPVDLVASDDLGMTEIGRMQFPVG